MKYLKSYNESIRDLMTPKSEEDILKSLKGLSNSELLQKSIKYEFLKGIEIALQNELTINDIQFIQNYLLYSINIDIIKLLITNNQIINKLDKISIYLVEKYKLGLHQHKEKHCEKWFKNILDNIYEFDKYNNTIIKYKSNGYNFSYDILTNYFWFDYDSIWYIFEKIYNLNYMQISLLTKYMLEKYLNIKIIKTHFCNLKN
jgi:hypothetical protein